MSRPKQIGWVIATVGSFALPALVLAHHHGAFDKRVANPQREPPMLLEVRTADEFNVNRLRSLAASIVRRSAVRFSRFIGSGNKLLVSPITGCAVRNAGA